ncbi:MAG: TetR/AcrR family transcriptional regulator, partial [Anaerolineales bacterium]
MSPKPSVKEERTQEIIEAAMKVFAEEGFHRATMDEIADEAGVSKGTLYLYFKGKDKIISSLLEWFFGREYSRFDKWVEENHSVREVLEMVTQMVVDDLMSIRPFMPVMFEFISQSSRNQTVGAVVQKSMYGFLEKITPIFERGIENGEIKDVDPVQLAYAYGAIIEGTILIWSYDLKKIDFADLMQNSMR